jgi:hypothetical protein
MVLDSTSAASLRSARKMPTTRGPLNRQSKDGVVNATDHGSLVDDDR